MIHYRVPGGPAVDEDGAIHRGGGLTYHRGREYVDGRPTGLVLGQVVHYRPAGLITSVGGARVAELAPATSRGGSVLDRIPIENRSTETSWPFITGRVLRWGEVGRIDRNRDEYFAGPHTVAPGAAPRLLLRHPTQNLGKVSLILGDHVETRSTTIGLDVTWALRHDLPDELVEFLATSVEDLPLSIAFRTLETPKITRPVAGGPILYHQRRVELNHVALVSTPAYRGAVLRRLARAA